MSGDDLAERILQARAQSRCLPASVDHGLTPEEAYRIQAQVLAPRMAVGGGRGGWKLGYTSAVMREQMGVAEPNFGPLATAMILDATSPRGAVVASGVTQPKVEPEIAAVLGADVPVGATIEQVRAAVRSWCLALEIVDSVWEGYQFDWALNTADGSSAAFVALGPALVAAPPTVGQPDQPDQPEERGLDLTAIEVTLEHNGREAARGCSDAAMGDPVVALHWLSQQVERCGEQLRAGDVVITGGLTRAVDLAVGDAVSATVATPTQLAGVSVRVRRD